MAAAPQEPRAVATQVRNAFVTIARAGTNGHEVTAPAMTVRSRATAVTIGAKGNQIRPVVRTASATSVVRDERMHPAANTVATAKHHIRQPLKLEDLKPEDLKPGHLRLATMRSTRRSRSPGITKSKRSRVSIDRCVPKHAARCTGAQIVALTGPHANHGSNGIRGTCGSHVMFASHVSHARTAPHGSGCRWIPGTCGKTGPRSKIVGHVRTATPVARAGLKPVRTSIPRHPRPVPH